MAEPSLQLGNGNWAGKSGNLLAYHKANNNFYADELTFARASTGTIVNADGLIEEVPYNVMPNSEPTSTGAFKTNVTFQATNIYGWNGIYYGDNSVRRIAFLIATAVVGQEYTFSAFVKMADGSSPSVGNSATDDFRMWNGSATTSGLTITDVGGGIYRCSVVRVATSTANNVALEKQTYNSAKTFEASGFQLVLGSVPKPYYATTDGLDYPRIDYSNGCGSLLLEPQRTNVALYSSEFDNAAYSLTESSITANASISPDGTENADKLVEAATSNIHRVGQGSISVTSGQVYTFSFYAKAAERDELELQRINTSGIVFNSISVTTADLTSGTLSVGSNVTASNIASVGDGWYRISISLTAIATGSGGLNIGMEKDGNVSYAGDGVSGVYLWGFQCELGSYPTSYIPTSGTTVTRIQDSSSTTGLSSAIGQTEGVLYAKIASFTNTNPISSVINISDGSASNQIAIWYGTNLNEFKILIRQSGNKLFHTTTLTDATQFIKVAVLYKSGGSKVYINGSLITSSTSPFTFTNPLSVVDFGGIG